MDINVTEALPKAFGGADLFGRRRPAGRTVVQYLGIQNGMAYFSRQSPKSGHRFSEKITHKRKARPGHPALDMLRRDRPTIYLTISRTVPTLWCQKRRRCQPKSERPIIARLRADTPSWRRSPELAEEVNPVRGGLLPSATDRAGYPPSPLAVPWLAGPRFQARLGYGRRGSRSNEACEGSITTGLTRYRSTITAVTAVTTKRGPAVLPLSKSRLSAWRWAPPAAGSSAPILSLEGMERHEFVRGCAKEMSPKSRKLLARLGERAIPHL